MNVTQTEYVSKNPVVCKTQHEILVAFLWSHKDWIAGYELPGRFTSYGHLGSSAEVRARELARNACAEKLQDKVQRAEGGDIGLDKRFTYFRYRPPLSN